jgi:cytochrome o ubiquinol oxidase subunit 1
MFKFRLWGPLWRDWITSIDHKKIGIMYMVLGIVMLLRGFADALMMRAQQAIAFGDNPASCRRTTTTRCSPPTA